MTRPKAFISIAIMAAALTVAPAARASSQSIATIIGVSGTGAKVVVAGSNYEVDAAPKRELNRGDSIKTPPGAVVSVLMKDGTQVKVNQLSRVTIGESRPGGVPDMADVKQGAAWAKISEKSRAFEIRTPTASAGVRGTELVVNVEDDGAMATLTIVEGAAQFFNEHGSVDVGPGQQSKAALGAAPSPPISVDARFFIEWTAGVESIGSSIELPLVSVNRYVLEDMAARMAHVAGAPSASAEDLAILAGVSHDLGDYEKALALFKKSLSVEDGSRAAFGLGVSLIRSGKSEQAVEHFEARVEKSAPETRADYLIGLGMARLKQNDISKAAEAFDAALDADSKLCLAWTGKGLSEMKQGRSDAAVAALRAALIADPECYQAQTRLAELELSRNNSQTAQDLAKRAADENAFSPEAQAALAKIMFFSGDMPAAKESALRAAALDPFHTEARAVLAMIAVSEGRLRDAQREALMGIALDPHNAQAHDTLAQVYMLRRNREAAILHWERAIEAVPTHLSARLNIARLMNAIHKPATAEKHLSAALDIEPENDRVIGEMGRALELQRKYEDAEDQYVKAVRLNPQYARTRARLASFYIDRFRLKDALREANAAVRAEPSNPAGYLALGLIHDELDNTESAALNYKQALQLDPENAEARYRLGIILGEDRARFFEALSEMRLAQLVEPTVVSREQLRDNTRYSLVFGENSYLGNTIADTGFGFNRNLIYKIRVSDQRENCHTHPKPSEYDPNLRELDAGGLVRPEMCDLGKTFLLNYRPDYYRSYTFSFDSGYKEQALPSRSLGTVFDTMDYSKDSYRRYELNHRRIFGTKSSVSAHLATTAASQLNSTHSYGAMDSEDTSSDYNEYEIMHETKYCKNCFSRVGAAFWRTTITAAENRMRTLDYSAWSNVFNTWERASYNERIIYTDQEFSIKRNFRAALRGESVKHDVGGSRESTEIMLAYRFADAPAGLYYREGQRWHVNAAESLRPADSWARVSRFDAGEPGSRYHYRELSADGLVTPATFVKAAVYERKRKAYTADSNYRIVDYRADIGGVAVSVERRLGSSGNINFEYIFEDSKDPLGGAPVADAPAHSFSSSLHYFFSDKWHARYKHAANSGRYASRTLTSAVDGSRKSEFFLYFEPNVSRRYFLHLDNIFGDSFPDPATGLFDNDKKIRFGADAWF